MKIFLRSQIVGFGYMLSCYEKAETDMFVLPPFTYPYTKQYLGLISLNLSRWFKLLARIDNVCLILKEIEGNIPLI